MSPEQPRSISSTRHAQRRLFAGRPAYELLTDRHRWTRHASRKRPSWRCYECARGRAGARTRREAEHDWPRGASIAATRGTTRTSSPNCCAGSWTDRDESAGRKTAVAVTRPRQPGPRRAPLPQGTSWSRPAATPCLPLRKNTPQESRSGDRASVILLAVALGIAGHDLAGSKDSEA